MPNNLRLYKNLPEHFLNLSNFTSLILLFGNNILDSVESKDLQSIFTPFQLVSLLDMLKFYAEKFVEVSSNLGKLTWLFAQPFATNTQPFKPDESVIKLFDNMCEALKEINLENSILQAERVREMLVGENPDNQMISYGLDNLTGRIIDELRLSTVFLMPRMSGDYYSNPNPFGDEVFNNFSSASFDIEEAGKCFALGRYTACVMHLQRVMEVGLKAYGAYLGIVLINPILTKAQSEMNSRNSASSWGTTNEKEFCENLQPLLHSVRVAWRNPSMHADQKYTEEEAEDIYNAVKGFMRHLAKHLNESGVYTP